MAQLSIIYNMFLFKRKQQTKYSNSQVDKNLQRLNLLAQSSQKKSKLNCYYRQICKSLKGKQDKFHPRYQKQISRIKKSETLWNYSDISIVRNCIKKSMLNETLSVLVDKWCDYMQIYLLEPMMDLVGNRAERVQTKQDKIKKIQTQILVFCEFVFSFGFEMYYIFFYRHYQRRSKLIKEGPSTKRQIYQRQQVVFVDYVRNTLTALPIFTVIYHQYLMVILNDHIYVRQNPKLTQDFPQFLSKELKINQKYQKIYTQTSKSIWDFYNEPSLEQKIIKSTYIIPSIEKDHLNFYKKQNMEPVFKLQTITTKILEFLFNLYCPQASVSIKYIEMLICYRQSKEKYTNLLEEFCFLWINEDTHLKFNVVADSFNQK